MHEQPATSRLRNFYFRIDLRSAGLFRILLAVILICHWFDRWHYIDLFYAADGVLPARVVLDLSGASAWLSPLRWPALAELTVWLSPLCWPVVDQSPLLVRTFFILALGCYLAFLVGYRTRLFGLLCLFAVASIAQRNSYCLIGADFVMGTLLLWAQFLPLGKRFSWDGLCEAMAARPPLRDKPWEGAPDAPSVALPRTSPFLVAAFGVVLNLGLIYLFTALYKTVPMLWGASSTWKDGSAIWYVWHMEQSIYPAAVWLRQLPAAYIRLMTWGTLLVEFLALPMFLIPVAQPWLRRIILLLLVVLHAGIAATVDAGLFSYTMFAGFALLLMAQDWQALRRLLARFSRSATVYYDDNCGICTRCCQALAVFDRCSRLTFIGASHTSAWRHPIPAGLTDKTIVVFDERGRMTIKSAGAATIFRALPLPWHVLRFIAWPGLRWISDRAYDAFARNRHHVSSALKMTSCGVPDSRAEGEGQRAEVRTAPDSHTSTRRPPWLLRHGNNALASVLLLLILANNWAENVDPWLHNVQAHRRGETPTGDRTDWLWRASRNPVIAFPAAIQHWNMFAPDAPPYDHWWLIDAETADGRHIDLLAHEDESGSPPVRFFDQPLHNDSRPGWRTHNCTWNAYLEHGAGNNRPDEIGATRILQREFCRFIADRHNAIAPANDQIVKLRLYDMWLESPHFDQSSALAPTDRLRGVVLADYAPATGWFQSYIDADPETRQPGTTIATWYPPRPDGTAQMKSLGTRIVPTAQQRQERSDLAWYYDGPYQEWRENGSPLQQGTMSHGKKVGRWTEWDEKGGRGEGPYRDDLRDGTWTYLTPNGRLEEGPYVQGKQTGLWIRYYAPKELPANVRQSSLDPARAAAYERLQLVDGKGQGAAQRFHPNGKLWMSGMLDQSRQTGVWNVYYPDGRLKARTNH